MKRTKRIFYLVLGIIMFRYGSIYLLNWINDRLCEVIAIIDPEYVRSHPLGWDPNPIDMVLFVLFLIVMMGGFCGAIAFIYLFLKHLTYGDVDPRRFTVRVRPIVLWADILDAQGNIVKSGPEKAMRLFAKHMNEDLA